MGMSLMGKSSSCGCENVDPVETKFLIIEVIEIGSLIIVIVKYKNCTTFEGNKILVYDNISKKDFLKLKEVDPHFCDKPHTTPIARFIPTQDGINMAVIFASAIMNKKIEERFKID